MADLPDTRTIPLTQGRVAIVDAASKGRVHGQAKTHCPSGHPYDGENLRIDEHGRRRCRACHKRHDAAFRDRRKLKSIEHGAGK